MDFGLILDELASNNILDIDIDAQPALTWDDISLQPPAQSELPPLVLLEPTLVADRGASGILAGRFEPPWLPGHFLYSRFLPPETQPIVRTTVASLTERLMRTALRSYPNMMQPDGVPPFIHCTHARHGDMRTALENCVSLVLLWKSQREFNKRFVEESVERERSRLFSEVCRCLSVVVFLCVRPGG